MADGYRAELVRAARNGLAFAPETGEPEAWAAPEPEPVTWYQHAVAYAEMKWPHLAPHSRASLADALATVTPLTRETGRTPPAGTLRAALYGHAFNPPRRSGAPERHRQPADRNRAQPGRQRAAAITVPESERLHVPSAPPQTLSAICPRIPGNGPHLAH
jgi:hypothetical protein